MRIGSISYCVCNIIPGKGCRENLKLIQDLLWFLSILFCYLSLGRDGEGNVSRSNFSCTSLGRVTHHLVWSQIIGLSNSGIKCWSKSQFQFSQLLLFAEQIVPTWPSNWQDPNTVPWTVQYSTSHQSEFLHIPMADSSMIEKNILILLTTGIGGRGSLGRLDRLVVHLLWAKTEGRKRPISFLEWSKSYRSFSIGGIFSKHITDNGS